MCFRTSFDKCVRQSNVEHVFSISSTEMPFQSFQVALILICFCFFRNAYQIYIYMWEVLGKTHKTMLNDGCDMWAPEFKTPNRNSHNHDIDFDYIYYLYRLQIRNFRETFWDFRLHFRHVSELLRRPYFRRFLIICCSLVFIIHWFHLVPNMLFALTYAHVFVVCMCVCELVLTVVVVLLVCGFVVIFVYLTKSTIEFGSPFRLWVHILTRRCQCVFNLVA